MNYFCLEAATIVERKDYSFVRLVKHKDCSFVDFVVGMRSRITANASRPMLINSLTIVVIKQLEA